jgi:hypothetical protein
VERSPPGQGLSGIAGQGIEITGRRNGSVDRRLVGDVEREPRVHREVVQRPHVAGRGDDLVATDRQLAGSRPADALRCSGDENARHDLLR